MHPVSRFSVAWKVSKRVSKGGEMSTRSMREAGNLLSVEACNSGGHVGFSGLCRGGNNG